MAETAATERGDDPTIARIEQLAAQRADAEVLNLLRSRPDLTERRHAPIVAAAALRELRRQFAAQIAAEGPVPPVSALVEIATAIMRPHPLTGRFPVDASVRAYLTAAIDWHVGLRETPYVAQFWDAMTALSQADLSALFDLRSRLVGLLAGIGLETALPAPLDAFVMGYLRRPYLIFDPHDALDLLAYGMARYSADGRLRDIVCDLLPDWCHYFAIADIQIIERVRHLYRLRDRVHGQLTAAFRTDPLWTRRFGTTALSAALAVIRLGQRPFFKSPGFIKIYGMRRWLETQRRLLGRLSRHRFVDDTPAAPADVLVTRAQGGLGDVMTMRPGLLALARGHTSGRIVFATRPGHFALFAPDDPITLVDIEAAGLDHRSFGRWIDLTVCPGARVEIAQSPDIRDQRIDIFAAALGVRFGGDAQRRQAMRFPADVDTQADALLAANGPAETPAVGIQLRSADSYKDFPALLDVARELATRYRVFVFDTKPIPRTPDDRFVAVTDQPFSVVMALAAKMSAIITPDSALLHLAGANGVPCVGLFGPTDGRLHAAAYPSLRALDLRGELPCVPCWRSESSKCALSDSYRSVCLHQLPRQTVVAALEDVLKR